MIDAFVVMLVAWSIGSTLYTIAWVKTYVKSAILEMERDGRETLRNEWSFMHQHLDNITAALDARVATALARQWDNGTKGRRNP